MSARVATPGLCEISESALQDVLLSQETHVDHYGGRRLPIACVRGHGIEIEAVHLAAGRRGEPLHLLDASGGYGSACLGAGHEAMRQSLERCMLQGGYVTDELASLERARLLSWLFGDGGLWTGHFPPGEYHVAGRNSGSEGLELAFRLVLESRFDHRRLRYRPGMAERNTILAFEGAWHGWTSGLLPLLNRRHYTMGLPGLAPLDQYGVRVDHIPFGDLAALREYFVANAGRLLAVFTEPIQGDAGILVPPAGYLRALSGLCAAEGALLVADEVLTFAKSGAMFAMRDEGDPVPADITVVGKSLGMGVLSTSMVIARRGLNVRQTGAVATSDLRPITCAVVHDGLRHIVAADLIGHSRELGARLSAGLGTELVERFPRTYTAARGVGVLHGVELSPAAASRVPELRESLAAAGVYVEFMAGAGRRSGGLRYIHPTMRVAPPLVTTPAQVDEIIARLAEGTRRFQTAS
ncbi:aminotransferase class III-fold pyridoxal phosphate-dependent enzyme [Nonomuraea sp. NPDC049480]|uniref:aminotransferase class III-fold pyridoxal phosphate-dependent enzyme n=1 Tax=Nonomuraea sp. NPDC049480 TaxID=3364353 RepID=UPI00378CB4DC